MDAPPVRYVETEDGVNIAYRVFGSGPPMVIALSPSASHIELEWDTPVVRAWFEALASEYTLTRFDFRGTGLSQHQPPYTVDALALDIAAVVDATSPDTSIILFANSQATAPVAEYARSHAGRVDGLGLWLPLTGLRDSNPSRQAVETADQVDASVGAAARAALTAPGTPDAEALAASRRGEQRTRRSWRSCRRLTGPKRCRRWTFQPWSSRAATDGTQIRDRRVASPRSSLAATSSRCPAMRRFR